MPPHVVNFAHVRVPFYSPGSGWQNCELKTKFDKLWGFHYFSSGPFHFKSLLEDLGGDPANNQLVVQCMYSLALQFM